MEYRSCFQPYYLVNRVNISTFSNVPADNVVCRLQRRFETVLAGSEIYFMILQFGIDKLLERIFDWEGELVGAAKAGLSAYIPNQAGNIQRINLIFLRERFLHGFDFLYGAQVFPISA
jgi:hypothetical protein